MTKKKENHLKATIVYCSKARSTKSSINLRAVSNIKRAVTKFMRNIGSIYWAYWIVLRDRHILRTASTKFYEKGYWYAQ